MAKSVDYYKLLGISIFASQEEIRSAYLAKVKQYHPDTYKGSKREAQNITASLNLAYDTLKDKDKKFVYDQRFGFDKLRDDFLRQQEKENRKEKKKAKKQAKKHPNPNTGDYAYEKQAKQKTEKEAEFNKKTQPDDKKIKTGIFSKKPKDKVKAVKRNVIAPDEKSEKTQRLVLDGIIIFLLIVVILLILFH